MGKMEIMQHIIDEIRTLYHFCDIPAQDAEPEPNHEEAADKVRNILQNMQPIIFKSIKFENQGKTNNFKLKETKEK